jgi:hypothetical protein
VALITESELAELQAMVADTLPDLCEIRHPGKWEFDPDAGHDVKQPGPVAVLLGDEQAIPCRVSMVASVRRIAEQAGEQDISVRRYVCRIPLAVGLVEAGWCVWVTKSRDHRIMGRPLVVETDAGRTYATTRELRVMDEIG